MEFKFNKNLVIKKLITQVLQLFVMLHIVVQLGFFQGGCLQDKPLSFL